MEISDVQIKDTSKLKKMGDYILKAARDLTKNDKIPIVYQRVHKTNGEPHTPDDIIGYATSFRFTNKALIADVHINADSKKADHWAGVIDNVCFRTTRISKKIVAQLEKLIIYDKETKRKINERVSKGEIPGVPVNKISAQNFSDNSPILHSGARELTSRLVKYERK